MDAAESKTAPRAPGTAIRLPAVAEFSLAQEVASYPKTEYSNLQFRGPLDVEAFRQAFRDAMRPMPLFHCLLEERRERGVHGLYWIVQERENELVVEDCRDRAEQTLDPVAFIEDYHRERTIRRMDLTREFPARFFLLRLADDVHLLSIVYHHIGFDAAQGYAFLRDLMARYHERVTGAPPEWALAPSITSHAAAPKTFARWSPLNLRQLHHQMNDIGRWTGGRVSLIASEKTHDELGRTCHRAVFAEPEVVRGFRKVAARQEATVTDVLLASIARTIGAWDRERGSARDIVRAMLAVNMRQRTAMDEAEGMRLSALFLRAERPERMDGGAAIRHFRDARKLRLARGADVALYEMLEFVSRVAVRVPVRFRAPLFRRLYEVPTTFVLSNIGVMWPRIVDGKPTGESSLTRAGNVEIDDVHSCPSGSPAIGLTVIARSLGGKLFVNFSCDRWRFTRPEAAALTDRIVSDLRATALS